MRAIRRKFGKITSNGEAEHQGLVDLCLYLGKQLLQEPELLRQEEGRTFQIWLLIEVTDKWWEVFSFHQSSDLLSCFHPLPSTWPISLSICLILWFATIPSLLDFDVLVPLASFWSPPLVCTSKPSSIFTLSATYVLSILCLFLHLLFPKSPSPLSSTFSWSYTD